MGVYNKGESPASKNQEILLANEISYRSLFENSMDAILLTSPDGNILSANPAACRLFGYSEEELIKLGKSGVVDVTDHQLFLLLSERFLKGKAQGELIFTRKDGTRFSGEVTSAIFKDHKGFERTSMIIRDLTERKRLEESLKKQKDEFETIFNLVPAQIWYKGTHNNFIRVNRQACNDIGMTNDKIEGNSAEELFPSFAQEYFKDDCEVFNTRKPKLGITEKVNTIDGKIRWVHTDKIPVFGNDGEVNGLIVFVQDITENKLAEKEVTMLAQSLRSVKECVSITDIENNILFVNSSFLNTYGYSEDELAGKHISIVRLPNMSPDLGKEIMPATLRGGWSGELWNKRKDGSEFLVYLSTTIIHDKDGNILGLIGVATDITERVRAEEEIKESKKQLERLNKHLNDVIENERLKISRDIHDELGQSLTVLKIDLHWTKENIGNKPDVRKKLNGMIDIVNKTIKRVQLISADLRPGMLDDLGLIPAIEWYSQQYEERTGLLCHLELHTVPDLDLQINLLLFRILQEGLTNIARHANAKNVEVKLYSLPGKIYLIIKDDGIGVSKKIINSRDSLGLIGMRERLKQFNGTLEIISSQNNGTRLVISVPIIK